MIINHTYKFIFIKTRKTAGTSVEILLSKFCDANDIVTPISEKDEKTRRELGYQGPVNYGVETKYYRKIEWARTIRQRRRREFYNHAPAEFIRDRVSEAVWNSYFKFTIERDPYDRAISQYYWRTSEPRPSIATYLNEAPLKLVSNWPVYTINDHLAVDYVVRYERLNEDLQVVKERLGLPGDLELPRAKGTSRTNRDHYSKVLDAEARKRVEIACAKEIAALGYRWTEQ
ncbi:MAG: sulfotransferase family 2 domain-containing protein [Bacteroidota bacterium]